MKERAKPMPEAQKLNPGGQPPLDSDNPLVESLHFRLSQRLLDAIKDRRAGRAVGIVLRELIERGLEREK